MNSLALQLATVSLLVLPDSQKQSGLNSAEHESETKYTCQKTEFPSAISADCTVMRKSLYMTSA